MRRMNSKTKILKVFIKVKYKKEEKKKCIHNKAIVLKNPLLIDEFPVFSNEEKDDMFYKVDKNMPYIHYLIISLFTM